MFKSSSLTKVNPKKGTMENSKADKAMDKKMGVKENSAKDKAMDRKVVPALSSLKIPGFRGKK